MKFTIEYNKNIEERILDYSEDEYSFDVEPAVLEINFNLVLNKLNLTVVDDNVIVQVWGFCPYGSWIKSNYNIPAYKKGIFKVKDEFEAGFSYSINEEEWPIYGNVSTGWICIGNPEKSEKTVEFMNNCVAVVDNSGELISLWLKPLTFPKL